MITFEEVLNRKPGSELSVALSDMLIVNDFNALYCKFLFLTLTLTFRGSRP